MHKRKALVFLLILLLGGCAGIKRPQPSRWSPLPSLEGFKKGERVLILAPHPDDEAIGCAGVIQEAIKAQAEVRIVYLTNGDHNAPSFIVYEKRITMRQGEFIHMGQVRQKEAIKAMEFLGLSKDDLVFLGYPDFGTFEIFCKYWQSPRPFRDRMTRISSVPYKNSPSYGAPYYAENILSDLTKQIRHYKPDKIFVTHPADVNVDHKTFYLFLQIALSDLEGLIPKPKVYPYLIHCVGWPKPRHYHPELELYPPDKFIGSKINWQRFNLSFDQLDKKHRSILFYKSQTESAAFYLLAFARENELFGDYPLLKLEPQAALEDKLLSYLGNPDMFKEWPHSEVQEDNRQAEEHGSVSYDRQNGYFIVSVDKPKKISGRFGVLLHVFGYSKETPFAKMPKIRIISSGRSYKVFSAKKRVIDHGVILDFGESFLTLKIPLKLLQDPDYLLVCLKAYHGNLPADVTGFRKIKLK